RQHDGLAVAVEEAGRSRQGRLPSAAFDRRPRRVAPRRRAADHSRLVAASVASRSIPLPTTFASRRCLWEPSLSGPKLIIMTTTFFGATRWPVAAPICFFSLATHRGYVLVLRS